MRYALFAAVILQSVAARAAPAIAVQDFSYADTSGEVQDQTATHAARIAALTAAIRNGLDATGKFTVVPEGHQPALVVTGAVHKMSTLVQWAHVRVQHVSGGQVLLDRLFTFRGDDEDAWRHAALFLTDEIQSGVAPASPTRLIVFPFELDDFSAAAGIAVSPDADQAYLAQTTQAVRHALADSRRFTMVAPPQPQGRHDLWQCGCDARIARAQGAAESLTGLVTRLSRTEYTIHIRLTDARSGGVLLRRDSGLRMGADYSWDRGAAALATRALLPPP